MELIKAIRHMQDWSEEKRISGRRIGFVPTMGFLHEGHLSLMRYARGRCDRLVASIFVNPLQFGPKEDLAQYPRDLDRDLELMQTVPVDAVFNPEPEEMYPPGYQTRVEVTEVTQGLCGTFRPGHFTGVATVVLKLFNIVRPHLAVFGEKDYQQLVTIQRMVQDLDLDLMVEGRPTLREPDGLAMSSRNVYLSPDERRSALALSESLRLAQEMVTAGRRDAAEILTTVRDHIESRPHNKVQYAALVDPATLDEVARIENRTVLALAVFTGRTRLIDNAVLEVP